MVSPVPTTGTSRPSSSWLVYPVTLLVVVVDTVMCSRVHRSASLRFTWQLRTLRLSRHSAAGCVGSARKCSVQGVVLKSYAR